MIKLKILLLKNVINWSQKIFNAKQAQANEGSKNDIANFVKKTDFDDKLKNWNKKSFFKLSKTCTCWRWIKTVKDIRIK